jgi:leader peptidase (prepilin peptidase)/N-methyltransferase
MAIKPYDNLPVLGWLFLRGRCRGCRGAISVRYPLVEALTGGLAVAVVLVKPSLAQVLLGLALIAFLVPIALIDLDYQLIPNRLTGPAAVLALALGLALHPTGVPEQLIAGAAGATFLAVFAFAYPKGMGMGDVKLAGVLGLYLGRSVAVAILAGVFVATLVGIGVMARLGVAAGRKTKVPFGPFLAFGGVLALFVGGSIVHWYLHAGL